MRRVMLMLAVACWAVLSASPAWAVLYGADGAGGNSSNLYTLDPATGGTLSTIGAIGYAVTGLAIHPVSGVLYGSVARQDGTAPGSLITIDKVTGLGTLVGPFNAGEPNNPPETMADLAFSSDGTLYGWLEPGSDSLYRIDITTGQATLVGVISGLGTAGSGLAATADAFILAGDSACGQLYFVDRATGRAAALPNGKSPLFLNGPCDNVSALSYGPGGILYGVALQGVGASLITIDPFTLNVTVIGSTVDRLDAIVFDPPEFPVGPFVVTAIPTLSEAAFALMAILLVAVAFHRMRGRRLRTS